VDITIMQKNVGAVCANIEKVMVGKKAEIELVLTALLAS